MAHGYPAHAQRPGATAACAPRYGEAVHAKLVRQRDYIAQHAGASVADRYIARLLDYFRGPATFPERGHPRPDILPGLHVIGFGHAASVAIVVEPDDVYVVGVYFGGEDHEGTLHEPPSPPYVP
ncbi:type II toxin-antitoxin system RelE/ParE family toxin [Rhodanobacter sp. DHB23]|uniref:type II toxin-antitoxin system RelE/ParE family toxin n=1 Tax=Rhodanobacter sp. DHB23 TaxID=2775923 RepID=UPI00177D7514|nr:type II toxin-antitoxin system RelE/ParE family toxin [Rhodanobacter sp. DHB23]